MLFLRLVTAIPLRSVCIPFGFPREKCVPFINMHNGRVHDVTYCYELGKKMRSSILIRYRFTNERRSSTMKAIRLLGLDWLMKNLLSV